MLSKIVAKKLMTRQAMHLPKMVKPGNYVCFCGCGAAANQCGNKLVNMPKRNF